MTTAASSSGCGSRRSAGSTAARRASRTDMNPVDAQRIVAAYAQLLEQHTQDDVYPASNATLPYPKDTIKTAIRTSLEALVETETLTPELDDYLEIAYRS